MGRENNQRDTVSIFAFIISVALVMAVVYAISLFIKTPPLLGTKQNAKPEVKEEVKAARSDDEYKKIIEKSKSEYKALMEQTKSQSKTLP